MLKHESEEVNIVIHLEQQFDSLFFLSLLKCFNDLFPLFNKHQIRVIGFNLFSYRLLNFTLSYFLGFLYVFEIWQRFSLLPWNGLIILNIILYSFILIVDTFFDFFHFFSISLFWVVLTLVEILNWLNIVSTTDSCIFMKKIIVMNIIILFVLWIESLIVGFWNFLLWSFVIEPFWALIIFSIEVSTILLNFWLYLFEILW